MRGGGHGYEFNKCAATLATWTLCAAGEVENMKSNLVGSHKAERGARYCSVHCLLR